FSPKWCFFFSSRRRHTRFSRDWSSDVCSSDLILGFGRSSLLEQKLVKNTSLFANCSAYVLGNIDPGLMVFTGKMEKGRSAEEAERALDEVVAEFRSSLVSQEIIEKGKNQSEAMKSYESVQLLNRAMNLAYYAHLG